MTTTAEIRRDWSGPAILCYGFRPFFISAGFWALASMLVWVGLLMGEISPPLAFDPTSWHAHEFLFGYLGAVLAGFLLTAVPNWTGRLPVIGWPLAGLWLLWLLGRLAVAIGENWPPLVVALADLALLLALAASLAREIIAGRNWRNLIVLAMLAAFIVANAVFHFEAAIGDFAASGYGLRLGLAAALTMIAVIGGRIVPSFTRNWLVKCGETRLPTSPMQAFDKVSLVVMILAMTAWVGWPQSTPSAVALTVAGTLHVSRLIRWRGWLARSEALVWALHVGYAFVPLGMLVMALSISFGEARWAASAQHVWMIGAIGLMTIAVMTRAILGHTGRALHAGTATKLIYYGLPLSLVARLASETHPVMLDFSYVLAAIAWAAAFLLFILIYGPQVVKR